MITVDEYLSTSYDPDVEYVDGELVERTGADTQHSRLMAVIGGYL